MTTRPRRSPAVLLGFLGKVLLLAGLLIALPINNFVEYAYFDRPLGLLGMVDSPGPIVVLVLGIVWYAVLWRRVDRHAWERIRSSRLLAALMLWAGAAYLFLWWVISCADGLADTEERTAMAALAFGAPVLAYYLARRAAKSWRRWRDGERASRAWLCAMAAAALVAVASLSAFYFLLLRPIRQLQALDLDADPATLREACHRAIRFPPAGHDAYAYLAYVGDETSVPRLIRALRWAPPPDEGWICTWSFCLRALRVITNQDVGRTHEAWEAWYEANGHKSRLEWIADGFTARGYDAAVGGGEATVRALLAALGKPLWGERPEAWWLPRNAKLLLKTCDAAAIRSALEHAVGSGTPEEKRGATRYWTLTEAREVDPLLRALLADADRTVRLCASGARAQIEMTRLTNPPGFLLDRVDWPHEPSSSIVPAERGVVYFESRDYYVVAYDTRERRTVWSFPPDGSELSGASPPTLDGDCLVFAESHGRLFRVRARDGAVAWEARLDLPPKHYVHRAPICGESHVAVWAEAFGDPVGEALVHHKSDGRLVARTKGRPLVMRGNALFVQGLEAVRILTLPGLREQRRLDVGHRVLCMDVQGDLACMALVAAEDDSSAARVDVWVEGWSLTEGTRRYSRHLTANMRTEGSRQASLAGGVLYIGLAELTCAIDPADGRLLWETALGGDDLLPAGDAIVLERMGELVVLDAASGEVRAHYDLGREHFLSRPLCRVDDRLYAQECQGSLYVFALPRHAPAE